MWSTFAAQFLYLLSFAAWNSFVLAPSLLKDALFLAWRRQRGGPVGGPERGTARGSVVFYEGFVQHARSRPVTNAFKYNVRLCMVNLDSPPLWWRTASNEGKTSLTADAVRATCETQGPVWLLTIPSCCGYAQNPISVYYAYGEDGQELQQCVAEVTNSPWGERVLFSFEPEMRDALPKSLHVSPFMDMKNTWRIRTEAPSPGKGESAPASPSSRR